MFSSRPSISCEFISIKGAISGAGDQLGLRETRRADGWSTVTPRSPAAALSNAVIYRGRKAEESSNKSYNSVAAVNAVRRQACPCKPDVFLGHTSLISPPAPPHPPCCCLFAQVYHQPLLRRWLIAFSTLICPPG